MEELISINDRRWSDLLHVEEHDFYQLPSFVELESYWTGTKACAFYTEIDSKPALIPLLINELPDLTLSDINLMDAVSPYGYPGILASGDMSSDDYKTILKRYVEFGKENLWLTSFIRLHPILNNVILTEGLDSNIEVVSEGKTISIDLHQTDDELFQSFRKSIQQDIRKLKRKGFDVRVDYGPDFNIFPSIYLDAMKRINAGKRYLYNAEYLTHFKAILGDRLHVCTVLAPNGEIASIGMFTQVGKIMQYHLCATVQEYGKDSPSKLMLYKMAWWGSVNGATKFHLGGGLGGMKDNLYRFKSGFSKNHLDFSTLKVIHDHERYGEILKAWKNSCVQGYDQSISYFPPYRY